MAVHQTTVVSLNASGQDIIQETSMPDSELLREKLLHLNKRWTDVCSEVNARKARCVGINSVRELPTFDHLVSVSFYSIVHGSLSFFYGSELFLKYAPLYC